MRLVKTLHLRLEAKQSEKNLTIFCEKIIIQEGRVSKFQKLFRLIFSLCLLKNSNKHRLRNTIYLERRDFSRVIRATFFFLSTNEVKKGFGSGFRRQGQEIR